MTLHSCDRAAGSFREHHHVIALVLGEIATIHAVSEMVLTFIERPAGHVEKPGKVGVTSPSEALRNVPWARCRGVANLIVEITVTFQIRPFRKAIDLQLQLVRQLPTIQLRKMPRDSHTVAAVHGARQVEFCRNSIRDLTDGGNKRDLLRGQTLLKLRPSDPRT
jgi:hypothetical protein